MPTGTTKIILTGENATAIKAINEVGTTSEKAAAKSSSAFDKSSSKIGGAFTKLDRTLGSFGVPFTGALGAIGGKLESSGGKAETFGKKLVHVGDVAALSLGAGLAFVGAASIKMALEGEASQARLETAIKNTGGSFDDFQGRIDNTTSKMADLGFNQDEVAASIASLTNVTHDAGKAISLEGLAADLARTQHISLADATSTLTAVEAGRFKGVAKIIGATKDANGVSLTSQQVIEKLTLAVKGQADAYSNTYAGALAVAQAKLHNLEEELGAKLLPVFADVVSGITTGVDTFGKLNAATDGVAGKMLLLSGGTLAAAYAGAKVVQAYSATAELFATVATKLGLKTAAEVADAAATSAAATANAANATAIEAEGVAAATTAVEVEGLTVSAGTSAGVLATIGVAAGTVAAPAIGALGEAFGQAKLKENTQDSGLLAKGMAILGSSISSVVPGAGVVTSALGFMGVGQDKAKKSSDDLTKATNDLTAAEADYSTLIKSGTASSDELAAAKARVATAAGHLNDEQGKQKGIQDQLTAAEQAGTGATNDSTDAVQAKAKAVEEAEQKLKSYTDAVLSSRDAELGARTSVLDVSDALDDYSQKAVKAAQAGGKNAQANRDLERASISVKTHINNVAQAAQGEYEKQVQLAGGTVRAADGAAFQEAALVRLRSTISPSSPFRAYLDQLIRQLDVATRNRSGSLHIETSVTLRRLGITITADNRAVTSTGLDFNAEGGPVRANKPTVVGEKGPELFIPGTAGTIIPNDAMPKKYNGLGVAGGTTNITIYASGIGDRELGRQVVQALREYQRTKGPINLKIAG